jgi:competence protein ComEC
LISSLCEMQTAANRPDLRLVPAATAMWAGALCGVIAPTSMLVAAGAGTAVAAIVVGHVVTSRPARLATLVALGCLLGGLFTGAARAATVRAGPVDELAMTRTEVRVTGVVTTDPQLRPAAAGRSAFVIARLRIEDVTGNGVTATVRTPVLLLAENTEWTRLRPGQQVSVSGRLAPAERSGDIAAVMRTRDPPRIDGPPGLVARSTEPLRAGLRVAVDDLGEGARGLVPALVVGDESLLPESVRADMQATGLSHLTAVSGTNVTILVIAVLGVARWMGVRSYALPVLGGLTVVGFVLLARPEPSVLRAAAMGVIALASLTASGRRRGLPGLAAAVHVLLLADPWLARDAGFALSVLATGAILVLAPAWRDAMRWLPRPLAEALAVPLAAQVACAPVVVAISAQASLASIPANILVAPVVAPATVLGAATAVISLVSPPAAGAVGWLAELPASWIVLVAEHGAELPGAVVVWPGGAAGVLAATAMALGLAALLPVLLRRQWWSVLGAVLLGATILLRPPAPGWPPADWLVVACDVGQGDALALRAGPATAVVIDAGPDPPLVDRCLDSLDIERVPMLVLTHFHADHVAGLPGVLDGRRVGRVLLSPLEDPAEYADDVRGWLEARGTPVSAARAGDDIRVGETVRLRVIWPRRIITDGSAPNNASIVLDATVDGIRMLLAGDVEPEAQRAIIGAEPGLRADVLKVPHHGSAHQEAELLTTLGATVGLVSVGAGNTYGHPAAETLRVLDEWGAQVFRTDVDGSIAVVRTEDGLGVVGTS